VFGNGLAELKILLWLVIGSEESQVPAAKTAWHTGQTISGMTSSVLTLIFFSLLASIQHKYKIVTNIFLTLNFLYNLLYEAVTNQFYINI